jgi:phosphoglycerate dehydrogenase-like enzyme
MINNNLNLLFLTGSQLLATKQEIDRLKDLYPSFNVTTIKEEDYTIEQLEKAHIVVGFPKPKDLINAKNLMWLHTPSSGIASYARKELYANPNIIITRSTGVYGRQIADYVMGSITAFYLNLFTYHKQMKQQLWKAHTPTKDLNQSTILIVGLGDIGSKVAIRAKAAEMRVIGIKRTFNEKPSYVDEIYHLDKLDELLPKADVVVLSIARTDQTVNLINQQRLELMKEDAILVNVGRGALVDEDALIKALKNNQLRGAILDVTKVEPLPKESKLWSLGNVLVTPHSSGISKSDPHEVFNLFMKNLDSFVNDKNKMVNKVDFTLQY